MFIGDVTSVSAIPNGFPALGQNPESAVFASAVFTPTNTAYGAGDLVDVAKEFVFTDKDGRIVPPGAMIRILSSITKIPVAAIPAGMTSYNLELFSSAPPSAQADNALFDLAAGDITVYRGALDLGSPVDKGSSLYSKAIGLDTDVKLTSSSLWGELITVGGHTPLAVARTIILYGIVL